MIMGIPPVITAALGYAAVFGSATNTLVAPVLIGLEVFGTQNALTFVLVCTLAYILNGNCSIYAAQHVAQNGSGGKFCHSGTDLGGKCQSVFSDQYDRGFSDFVSEYIQRISKCRSEAA